MFFIPILAFAELTNCWLGNIICQSKSLNNKSKVENYSKTFNFFNMHFFGNNCYMSQCLMCGHECVKQLISKFINIRIAKLSICLKSKLYYVKLF